MDSCIRLFGKLFCAGSFFSPESMCSDCFGAARSSTRTVGHFHTTLAVDMAGFVRDMLRASHGWGNSVARPGSPGPDCSREYSRGRHSWNSKGRDSPAAGRPRDRKQLSYGETSHDDHRWKRCVFHYLAAERALLDSRRTFWLFAFHD
jgi:hypothetical protein